MTHSFPSNVCPFPLALWAHSDVNPDNDGWAEGRWCSFLPMFMHTMIFCLMTFSWRESQNPSDQSAHLENKVLSIKPWIFSLLSITGKWDATNPFKQCWALQKVTRKPTRNQNHDKYHGTWTCHKSLENKSHKFQIFLVQSPLTFWSQKTSKRERKGLFGGNGTVNCYTDWV